MKLNWIVTAAITVTSCFSLHAQDCITLKSGDEIKSKVIEVAPDMIKYKKWENPDGPSYTLEKAQVFIIKYQNGTRDVFNETVTTKAQAFQAPVPAPQPVPSTPIRPVRFERMFFGGGVFRYVDDESILPFRNMDAVFSRVSRAQDEFRRGKRKEGWALALNIIGGGAVGVVLATAGEEGGPGHGIAFLGGIASIAVGTILEFSAKGNYDRAAAIYSAQGSRVGAPQQIEKVSLGFTRNNGVGLVYQF